VPGNDGYIGKAVEGSGQDHADDLNSGFVMPANPARANKESMSSRNPL
jgi:hypothetical protein